MSADDRRNGLLSLRVACRWRASLCRPRRWAAPHRLLSGLPGRGGGDLGQRTVLLLPHADGFRGAVRKPGSGGGRAEHLRPARSPGWVRPPAGRARARDNADLRRHYLRRVRVAQRAAPFPAAWCARCRDQLCDAPRSCALGRVSHQAVGNSGPDCADRLPRMARHFRECRACTPTRDAQRALALVRRRVRHDAGDDVRLARVSRRRPARWARMCGCSCVWRASY